MAKQIPSTEDVRAALRSLERGDLPALSRASGVPATTLVNIRDTTEGRGPSVDTVRKFWPHLEKMLKAKAD